jgi:23S rRNA pseudouridine1911/1915/1917 synthase
VEPGDFPAWILFEDSDVLVLNKPGWLVCHPSKNGPWSSLVGAAKEYLGVDSVHLASRLDRETSGVVLLAKHRKAASLWQKGIERKTVRRSYFAIVRGEMSERRELSTFLGKDPESSVFVKQRVMDRTRTSKRAESVFEPLGTAKGHTFCMVSTKTGRKHQIRAHAQAMGHELVGEKLYGPDESIYLQFCQGGWQPDWLELLGMSRQALHGRSLGFLRDGPVFYADLAPDMCGFLRDRMGLKEEDVQSLLEMGDDWARNEVEKELSCLNEEE